ncbi:Dedicator of cytokinesis protein 9 [Halocaridina rubra]|uniref:Dedicator of cytokinesis protein 9 n=1 Tax=Halocaridina rubra TaxID=373956 RepID=A0AAN9A2F6_HALRR
MSVNILSLSSWVFLLLSLHYAFVFQRTESENGSIELVDESLIWPYDEKFGSRFRVYFESLKFRLQAPLDSGDGPLSQLEPYLTCAALYDAAKGSKISEDFHFDLNNPVARNLLSCKFKKIRDEQKEAIGITLPLILAGVPEEWIAHPKQAVMSVTRPHSDIFLVVRIEKVLQGSVSQIVEPYLKSIDPKSIQKLQRTIKTCCQRLGDFRMPFGWCARPLFKNSGHLDTESHFSPIYRCEEKKLNESEIVKMLADIRKPEKMNKLTVIPGSVIIKILPMEVTLPSKKMFTCSYSS